MYLPDSNAWIIHLRTKGLSQLSARLKATPKGLIKTCSVVRAELMTGALKSNDVVRESAAVRAIIDRLDSLPFDDAAADEYARVRSTLERQGQKIGAYDLQIAAIALVHNLVVVTHNTREFSRVAGLSVEDWQ